MPLVISGSTAGGRGRPAVLAAAAARGLLGGLAGAAAMTASQRLERAVTGRPASHVPGRTLLLLAGRSPGEDDRPGGATLAMVVATSAALGAVRGVWRASGLLRVRADVAQTLLRIIVDQTLENATGAGAPPRTWRSGEGFVEVVHAAVAAVATGAVVERLVEPVLESRRGTTSH
ncbi:hypothetical protein [Kineococcus rhizosphaerae]|uniref:Uncharacterized protein n=1 Tax=Kineococcus rhizosphaerae TaxID=559628 RepID=A0A2T0R2X8_9ACTN|nr:hypothetical protein [Kineococcus rhizosphaerae]PRY14162.1 hypothetical protein CLV37_107281 [Kineococcus rhizosphaerae]